MTDTRSHSPLPFFLSLIKFYTAILNKSNDTISILFSSDTHSKTTKRPKVTTATTSNKIIKLQHNNTDKENTLTKITAAPSHKHTFKATPTTTATAGRYVAITTNKPTASTIAPTKKPSHTTTKSTTTSSVTPQTSQTHTSNPTATTSRTTTSPSVHTPAPTTAPNPQIPLLDIKHRNLDQKVQQLIPDRVRAQGKDLKEQGKIRISIHGTKLYSNAELSVILKRMKVETVATSDPTNVIVGLVKYGTLEHVKHIDNLQCPTVDPNNDCAATFNFESQVNAEEIIREVKEKEEEERKKTQKPIPPLIEHLDPIIEDANKPAQIYFNKKAFRNYTNIQIPENIAILLAMGPKFSIPIYYNAKDFDQLKEAADFINESFGEVCDKATIRDLIYNHVKNYQENQYTQHGSEIRNYFHKALKDAKTFFKRNPGLIATQADKANCAIIMDRETYKDKIKNLLKNTTNYCKLKSSSTPAYMIMNGKILDRMMEAKMLNKTQGETAKSSENHPAQMYALIKTHKITEPARPIVNTRGSMGYTAAEVVTRILNKARETGKYNVLNSAQAVEKIKNTKILPNEKFHITDVKDMFTNISTARGIDAVRRRRNKLNIDSKQMSIIIDTINFVCNISTEIAFDGDIYKQIKGLKMGSSLSPILADFVMEDMLDRAFINIPRPLLIMKYVDDILFVATVEEGKELVVKLNEADEHIKFVYETQEGDVINYLDITIINKAFDISTKWFQKHISSGRFLNYLSHHSRSVILNTAITFVHTMLANTSPQYHEEITNRAKHLLEINSFPNDIINNIIYRATDKHSNRSNEITRDSLDIERKQYGTSIPYIPRLSEQIARDLNSDKITPYRPTHKVATEIFNPSKAQTQREPSTSSIIVTDKLDLTQEETHHTQ